MGNNNKSSVISRLFNNKKSNKNINKKSIPVKNPTKKPKLKSITPTVKAVVPKKTVDNAITYIKTGRPTIYKDEYCELALKTLAKGKSITYLAAIIGVLPPIIYNWCKKNKKFDYAIKLGKVFSAAWWEEQGQINIHNKLFNHVLWMMNMSNRFGWSSSHNKVTGTLEKSEKKELKVTFDNSDNELAKVLQILNESGAFVEEERPQELKSVS